MLVHCFITDHCSVIYTTWCKPRDLNFVILVSGIRVWGGAPGTSLGGYQTSGGTVPPLLCIYTQQYARWAHCCVTYSPHQRHLLIYTRKPLDQLYVQLRRSFYYPQHFTKE